MFQERCQQEFPEPKPGRSGGWTEPGKGFVSSFERRYRPDIKAESRSSGILPSPLEFALSSITWIFWYPRPYTSSLEDRYAAQSVAGLVMFTAAGGRTPGGLEHATRCSTLSPACTSASAAQRAKVTRPRQLPVIPLQLAEWLQYHQYQQACISLQARTSTSTHCTARWWESCRSSSKTSFPSASLTGHRQDVCRGVVLPPHWLAHRCEVKLKSWLCVPTRLVADLFQQITGSSEIHGKKRSRSCRRMPPQRS